MFNLDESVPYTHIIKNDIRTQIFFNHSWIPLGVVCFFFSAIFLSCSPKIHFPDKIQFDGKQYAMVQQGTRAEILNHFTRFPETKKLQSFIKQTGLSKESLPAARYFFDGVPVVFILFDTQKKYNIEKNSFTALSVFTSLCSEGRIISDEENYAMRHKAPFTCAYNGQETIISFSPGFPHHFFGFYPLELRSILRQFPYPKIDLNKYDSSISPIIKKVLDPKITKKSVVDINSLPGGNMEMVLRKALLRTPEAFFLPEENRFASSVHGSENYDKWGQTLPTVFCAFYNFPVKNKKAKQVKRVTNEKIKICLSNLKTKAAAAEVFQKLKKTASQNKWLRNDQILLPDLIVPMDGFTYQASSTHNLSWITQYNRFVFFIDEVPEDWQSVRFFRPAFREMTRWRKLFD